MGKKENGTKKSAAFKTLLTSVLFSAYGPVVLGAGLMVGHSSTQIADFARRTAELIALIVALVSFCITEDNEKLSDTEKAAVKKRGNTLVGAIMCLSGVLMLLVLLVFGRKDKGNVVPALIIALLGAVFNSFFFFRYTHLFKKT